MDNSCIQCGHNPGEVCRNCHADLRRLAQELVEAVEATTFDGGSVCILSQRARYAADALRKELDRGT